MTTSLEEFKKQMSEDKTPTAAVFEQLRQAWHVYDNDVKQERLCEHLIAVLHCRADDETLAAASDLLKSGEPADRCLGATILGQVKLGDEAKGAVAADLLFAALNSESHEDVLRDLIFALGHTPEPRALPKLLSHCSHPSSAVRYALASSLPAYPEAEVITALIGLMEDVDLDVRDWATFGIGSMMEADSPEIRQALKERLHDSEPDPRGEAMVGLAVRGDSAVVPAFIRELGAGGLQEMEQWILLKDTADAAILAAHESGDPQWLPLLLKLKEISYSSDQLAAATEKCSRNPQEVSRGDTANHDTN